VGKPARRLPLAHQQRPHAGYLAGRPADSPHRCIEFTQRSPPRTARRIAWRWQPATTRRPRQCGAPNRACRSAPSNMYRHTLDRLPGRDPWRSDRPVQWFKSLFDLSQPQPWQLINVPTAWACDCSAQAALPRPANYSPKVSRLGRHPGGPAVCQREPSSTGSIHPGRWIIRSTTARPSVATAALGALTPVRRCSTRAMCTGFRQLRLESYHPLPALTFRTRPAQVPSNSTLLVSPRI